jgi:hypothetical protein
MTKNGMSKGMNQCAACDKPFRALNAQKKYCPQCKPKVSSQAVQKWRRENPDVSRERRHAYYIKSEKPKIDARASEIIASFEAEACFGRRAQIARVVLREAQTDWLTRAACNQSAVDEHLASFS